MRRTVRTAGLILVVLLAVGFGLTALGHRSSTRQGDAPFLGSAAGLQPHAAAVDVMATTSGGGYWLVAADGGVFSFGDAAFHGSLGGVPLAAPILDGTTTPSGGGYYLVASDGGVFAFGDARFQGSAAGAVQGTWVTGIAATPSGNGYWLLYADGGVATFGDAPFLGSAVGMVGAGRAISIAATPSGNGYWIASTDGGVYTFGDAGFHGSLGATRLNAPIQKIAAKPTGDGYWLVGADGGVFCFDAPMYGSTGGARSNPILGIAASPAGDGYWLVASDGSVFSFDANGAHGDPIPSAPSGGGGGATRVGPSNPSALQQMGEITISTPGQVVENVDVWGPINITASNVTVRNFRAAQVRIDPSTAGTVLEDGEVHGYFDPNFQGDGVSYARYTARRLDVHNLLDAFKAQGDVLIEDSWIHDLNGMFGASAGAGGYSHNDGVQVSTGSHIWIRNNRFERVGNNAAVFIDADQGPIDDVVVEQNFLDGGGITLYSIQSRSAPWHGAPTNVRIRNNVFGPNHKFDYALLGGDASWENNVDLNWNPIDAKRE